MSVPGTGASVNSVRGAASGAEGSTVTVVVVDSSAAGSAAPPGTAWTMTPSVPARRLSNASSSPPWPTSWPLTMRPSDSEMSSAVASPTLPSTGRAKVAVGASTRVCCWNAVPGRS